MNASPSSQSVGSQKPSTAASTASGRRTRTIIVARNLPESASSTSTPLPSASSFSSSSSSQSRHTRDAKPVKLNSYAALGSDADVELYERFLSEKKAVLARSLSGDGQWLDGGSAAPAMLKGSPKRRTTAQLLPAGECTEADVAASLTATPPPEDAEAVADARQRRAAVVRHRKWLQSLPIHERLAYERQQHAREKWQAVNRQWEAFKQRTARRLGKPAAQLVMSRAAAYREQVEAYDALQRATPLADKVAGDFWLVSLRNEGTRYVPVGNIFSGLYCPIRESSKLQPRVRRPLDYLDAKGPDEGDEGDDNSREARPTLERRALEALERKKRRLRKQLEALYPHEVESSRSGQLRVDTADLFEWASAGRGGQQHPQLHQAASTRSLLLPLEEEDAGDADASHSHRSTARSRRTARRMGPSLRVFARDDNEDNGGLDAGPQQQPQVTELTFFADVGVMQHHTVWLENDGTTAIQFQWRREDRVDDDALAARLTRHHTSPLAEPKRVATTSVSQRAGVVLPDETLAFVFSFRATRAGVWLERWLLDVDPAPPGLATRQPAAIVRLQSTAVDNFVPVSQRCKLGAVVEAAKTKFMAEQVLKHDVIQRVDPRYAVTFPALGEEARRFYDAHRHGAFANVQFSERLMAQCHALYEDAQAVLAPPGSNPGEDTSAPSEDQQAASPRDPVAEGEAAAPPPPAHPVEWDGMLASLQEVATAADEALRAAYVAHKSEQLAGQGGPDADDEEEDLMEKLLGIKARQRAAQQDALRALEPHFVDDFQSLTLAAHVTPYEPRVLSETLAEKLAAMASEAAVVVEIAQMMHQADGASSADACGLLKPLLVRALDESVAADAARERVFEDAKRHFQSVKLGTKASFRELPRLVLDDSMAPLVLFLQVDLDVANWFTLTPTGSSPAGPLEWKLSQKLLEHRTHVPPKIAAACQSIQTLLETMEVTGRTPTIVVISELSLPPMTKAMKRSEVAAARANAVAAIAGDAADGAPAPVPTPDEIETTRLRLAAAREKQLSLRGVDVVLQRALRARSADHEVLTIEFVPSLQGLETAFKPATPRPLTRQVDVAETSGGGGEPRPPTAELKPRILLLDHLAVLSRQALKKPQAAAVAPPTPSAAPPAAADKGKAAANDKRKSTAQPPPTQPSKAPVAEPAAVADEEADTIEILPGMSVEMLAAQSLGQRLARVGRFLVADFFPRSWWETAFVYFTAPPPEPTPIIADGGETAVGITPPHAPRHLLAGPRLLETFTRWQSLFQPAPESRDMAPMRAIVGGRGLERKLRLIDGLLERVSVMYFVGEIGASLYRVLATRQRIKTLRRERKLVPRYESQWLIAAVERVIQKAYRKHVDLLLPFDFVVGESPLDSAAGGDDDGDDEDDEDVEEEEDEEEEDEDEEDTRKKKSKKPTKPQRPLQEPPEVDTWRSRKSYDGERGVVEVGSAWIRFADVTVELLARASVVDGKSSLLEAAEAETDEAPTALPSTSQVIPELDWTQRIFDVGPKSTKVLISDLRAHREEHAGWVFMNGTLGALEYREFDASTREVVGLLEAGAGDIHQTPLVTGKSTCQWLEWLSFSHAKRGAPYTPVVSNQMAKQAAALSYVIESKPHATLTAFDTTR